MQLLSVSKMCITDVLLFHIVASVDARGKYIKDAQHFTDTPMLNGRAHLRTSSDKVRLIMETVSNSDEGVYKCRVDFKKSPTRNSRIHLSVISESNISYHLLMEKNNNNIVDRHTHVISNLSDDTFVNIIQRRRPNPSSLMGTESNY